MHSYVPPTQRKEEQTSSLEEESQIGRSAAPPAFGFADDPPTESPADGNPLQMQEGPGDAGDRPTETPGAEGGDVEAEVRAAFDGAEGGEAESETADPPHELVDVNDRSSNKVNDAIQPDLDAVVTTVQTLTGQDMGTGFGDTTRRLGSTTTKRGADNFSWHKTGRAVDFNQGLPWVIAEDPSGDEMYFRIYLRATAQGPAEGADAPAEGETWAHPSPYARQFTREADAETIHHNGIGNRLWTSWMIDVTAILEANGFERIPAHAGWEGHYNSREWWHYVNDDGLTWYQALAQIYTREQIVTGVKTFATERHGHAGRLAREGFPDDVLQEVWDNTAVSRNGLDLFFSVGSNRNCANIYPDIATVRMALNGLGIALADDTGEMITAFQTREGFRNPDGYITVGGTTHSRIGQRMREAAAGSE